jgi:hypothetical protein
VQAVEREVVAYVASSSGGAEARGGRTLLSARPPGGERRFRPVRGS